MASYLLDTCAWIDALLAPEKLSPKVRKILGNSEPVFLSTISLLEFTRKEARGQIKLNMPCRDWLEQVALPAGKITLIPLSPRITVEATRLPAGLFNPQGKEHKDPADQIIVATARCNNLTLLTSDKVLLTYSKVRSLASRK